MDKDVLRPEPGLLIALGSALIHAEEFMSPLGDVVDQAAFGSIMRQPAVQEWIKGMNELAFLPVKRTIEDKKAAMKTRR
jgi:hypothetical protein